jgi:hypothetical protein
LLVEDSGDVSSGYRALGWECRRAARTKHERREVARWAQAAELAQRADQAAAHVIAHCLDRAFGRTGALDLEALRSLRTQVAQRTAWPSWSWLPNTIFVEDLLATNGIDIDQRV